MAGAGYKQFADGDVLTAAQVQTFLQDQAVMRFADSSARDAALGTAIAEGMVAYLDDTDEVQVYDGTAWGGVGLALGTATPTDGQFLSFGTATSTWNPVDAPGNAGIGSNVVQTLKTNTFTTSSTSYQDITGFSVTITPTSASSKILLIVDAKVAYDDTEGDYRLLRDATAIYGRQMHVTSGQQSYPITSVYLDSPATTSPVTYKAQGKRTGPRGTFYFNLQKNHGETLQSSITAIEVAV